MRYFLAFCLVLVSAAARAGHFPVTAAYGTAAACAAFAEGGVEAVEAGQDVSAILVTPTGLAAPGLGCPADKAEVAREWARSALSETVSRSSSPQQSKRTQPERPSNTQQRQQLSFSIVATDCLGNLGGRGRPKRGPTSLHWPTALILLAPEEAMTKIADFIREIISDHFKTRQIGPASVVSDARLVEDLGADSLDLVEIAFALEDQFGREFAEEETERILTVGDIIALVEREP